MRPKTISPFFSITLTLLAAAACGYLNKDRLNKKVTVTYTDSKPLPLPKKLNKTSNAAALNAFTNYHLKKTGR